jgi:hypothetical protein
VTSALMAWFDEAESNPNRRANVVGVARQRHGTTVMRVRQCDGHLSACDVPPRRRVDAVPLDRLFVPARSPGVVPYMWCHGVRWTFR